MVFCPGKFGRFVHAEDSREARRVDLGFYAGAPDLVLHAVEGEFAAQELEELVCAGAGDVGLEVEEVEMWLVVDWARIARRSAMREADGDVRGQRGDGDWVIGVFAGWAGLCVFGLGLCPLVWCRRLEEGLEGSFRHGGMGIGLCASRGSTREQMRE